MKLLLTGTLLFLAISANANNRICNILDSQGNSTDRTFSFSFNAPAMTTIAFYDKGTWSSNRLEKNFFSIYQNSLESGELLIAAKSKSLLLQLVFTNSQMLEGRLQMGDHFRNSGSFGKYSINNVICSIQN